MEREFWTLKKVERIIDVSETGRNENGLYDEMAHTLKRLHENTVSNYRKQDEFAYFHNVLDQLRLDRKTRLKVRPATRRLVYSSLLDQPRGCMIRPGSSQNGQIRHRQRS